jgi:hypothetical protein
MAAWMLRRCRITVTLREDNKRAVEVVNTGDGEAVIFDNGDDDWPLPAGIWAEIAGAPTSLGSAHAVERACR